MYERFGDKRILERHYDAMAHFIEYMRSESDDLIRPDIGFGDWLSYDAFTPLDLLGTAYFAHSSDLMTRVATVLDRPQDVAKYRDLFERICEAFNNQYVTPHGRIVGDTQTCYVVALQFNLLPEHLRGAALKRLVYDIHEGRRAVWPYPKRQTHLSTGFLGVQNLLHVLTRFGHTDLAYRLLLTETYPSWLFPIKQGATTIWERWDAWTPASGFQDPGMNSFNHYANGAIGQWLYEVVAGIRPDPEQPGYKHVIIEPRPGALTRASASLETMYGHVASAWELRDGRFELHVTVAPNTQATVRMPSGQEQKVPAGQHVFSCLLP
jgi:alpha-L-rhamnosidase